MQLRDFVTHQICHRETHPVPYTLPIEEGLLDELDRHYGGQGWRDRILLYIHIPIALDYPPMTKQVDGDLHQDGYGGIWRMGFNIPHQAQAPLPEPSLHGFRMFDARKAITEEKKALLKEECAKHPNSFRICMVGTGIWEMCWHLRGFENALMDTVAEPAFFDELTYLAERQITALVEQVLDLPFDAIMLADDWGGQRGVLLGAERWRRYIKPGTARIIETIHAADKLACSHCCGSVAEIMPDIIEIGLDVLESVQVEAAGMDPYVLKREYGDHITFWGGLGSQSIIYHGTPAQLQAEIEHLISKMGRGGGYILAPAKGLMVGMPVENAAAIVEAFTLQE
jgi:uroporphyrinogen decarboxylase